MIIWFFSIAFIAGIIIRSFFNSNTQTGQIIITIINVLLILFISIIIWEAIPYITIRIMTTINNFK